MEITFLIQRIKRKIEFLVRAFFDFQPIANMQTIAIMSLLRFVKIKIEANENVLQDGFP